MTDTHISRTDRYIDLHMHLDGAITVPIAKRLATIRGMKLPVSDDEIKKLIMVSDECKDLNDFLRCFEFPLSLLQTPDGISEALYLVAEKVKKDGVIYAEIRFAPQLHTAGGMSKDQVIKSALSGIKRTDMHINLILCLMRGDGNEKENEETLKLAEKYLTDDGGVVGIDLAGAEALFPTDRYKAVFERARDLDIPFTIHAGEASGPESVRLAIEYGAKRIGHGTRTIEDESVMALAKERGVVFEMCPTSNLKTRVIEDISGFPFMKYLRYGIKVTLNTDDPAIEGITLSDEYELMRKNFLLTPEDERIIADYALEAAFTTDEVRQSLSHKE